jgi:hypothetical protein
MGDKLYSTVSELAAPLHRYLERHFPKLSEEARIAFAVQIALAHERGEPGVTELYWFRGGRSPN